MQVKDISRKLLLLFILLASISNGIHATKKKRPRKTVNQKEILEAKIDIEEAKDTTNLKLVSLYNEAMDWLKTPYRRGGVSKNGIDCSGFTGMIYNNVFGVKLQRRSTDIAQKDVKDIPKNQLKPGDLVFFATSRGGQRISHVGVYIGNNQFVHASTSNGVIISDLNESYYQRTWVKGGRVEKVIEKTDKKEIPTT